MSLLFNHPPAGSAANRVPFVFALLIFTIFMVVYAPRLVPSVLNDPDTSWHIASGQLIRDLGTVPATDPWSFTANGAPWYNLSWAFDLPLSLLYEMGGFTALALAAVMLSALLMAWTGWRALRESSLPAAFLATLLCGNLLTVGVTMRPYLASLFLLLAFLELLRRAEREPPHARGLLWQLPLLMLLWVNLHGAFLAGFIVLGIYGFAALLEKRFVFFTQACWAASLCLLATLLNPIGYEIYLGAWRTLGGALPELILEWKPPVLGPREGFTWLVLLFVACFHWQRPRRPLSETMLIFIWLLLAFGSKRYILFAAVALCPALAASLHASFSESRFRSFYEGRVKEYSTLLNLPLALSIFRAAALAAVIGLPLAAGIIWQGGIQLSQSDAPVKEMAYAAEHYPNAKILNFYDYGGYLLLTARGKLRPFIDGRAETAYPDKVTHDYIRFQRLSKGWEKIPDTYGADLILVPKDLGQRYLFDRLPGWRTVYAGQYAVLYARIVKGR